MSNKAFIDKSRIDHLYRPVGVRVGDFAEVETTPTREQLREQAERCMNCGIPFCLGCGCPLWASVGLVDAVRIGRDVGVKWSGDQSAESLLRDQATRNHAAGRLWQADPDCILLRDRFHDLSDAQVTSLALLAGRGDVATPQGAQ